MESDVFIDVFVLCFIGTLILILFCIGKTINGTAPVLPWVISISFYVGGVVRFAFRGFFDTKKEISFVEEKGNE